MNWWDVWKDRIALPLIGIVITLIGGALLNFFTGGLVIASLGGVTRSEIARVVDFDTDTSCGKVFNRRRIGPPDKFFCSLTDVSVRGRSDAGWRACRFGTEEGARWLIADLHGTDCPTPDAVEIYCKAQCINWN
ncbi:hypothetical protein V5F59_05845 [Xanthobacter autotrophicus DSM 431]|uniref:hypothetical protein n=1 Tax=Xanthobacter nonsaccharivorans TaxID=3119912 RepID=UPI0037279EE4